MGGRVQRYPSPHARFPESAVLLSWENFFATWNRYG